MTKHIDSSRRAFFLKSSAALGAGVTSTGAGAATLLDGNNRLADLQRRLDGLDDEKALEQLQLLFTTALDQQHYDTLSALFTADAGLELSGESAHGHAAIDDLFRQRYADDTAALKHTAHRQDGQRQHDSVRLGHDGQHASGRFHYQVQVASPLRGNSVAADMARQQGMVASQAWQHGCYDVSFARVDGQWRISGLRFARLS